MAVISVKGGNSQQILDGSQDTLSLLAITTGTGVIHIGDPAPEGFDVPFAGGDKVVLPANLSATLRADGFVVTGSIGAYGGQTYSGGIELLPTQAIIDDGQQITASNGQTISVAVADNVPSLTIKNWAFWEPFTVTAGDPTGGGFQFGYVSSDVSGDEQVGSITNEPVVGFSLGEALWESGDVYLSIRGPRSIASELQGALIGIDGVDYSPIQLESLWNEEEGNWKSVIYLSDVPAWTVDQQIPIVITPQNGG